MLVSTVVTDAPSAPTYSVSAPRASRTDKWMLNYIAKVLTEYACGLGIANSDTTFANAKVARGGASLKARSISNTTTSSLGATSTQKPLFANSTTPLYTFPTPGPEATSCISEQSEYQSKSLAYTVTWVTFNTTLPTFVSRTVEAVKNPRATTLCDGHARLLENPFSTIEVTYTSWVTETQTPTLTASYEGPKPTCTINSSDCAKMVESFSSAFRASTSFQMLPQTNTNQSGWSSTREYWRQWKPWGNEKHKPGCPKPRNPPMTDSCGSDCMVGGTGLTVLYFPQSVEGGMCGTKTITAAPTISGQPNTVQINGTTFTSGYVYLSFAALSAESRPARYVHTDCGVTRSNVLISMRPEELRSIAGRYHRIPGSVYSFNLADWNDFYPPFSVYEHGRRRDCTANTNCNGYNKTTETSQYSSCMSKNRDFCTNYVVGYDTEGYQPTVSLPSYVMSVDPMWSTCKPFYLGLGAKPYPLSTFASLPEATTTAAGSNQPPPSAYPGSAIIPPSPSVTSNPESDDIDW